MNLINKKFFNNNNINLLSKIGTRATLGLTMLEIAKNDNKIIVLTSDVSTSAGLDRFRKKYPEKFIEVGIAEQNLMGIATGLASEGFKVLTTTFSPFQTLRCCEQIKVNLGYMEHKVVFVGLASGLVLGNLGFTHCSIEDIAVIRSIPNISIVCPADGIETAKAIEASLSYNKSVYIRLTGGSNLTKVYDRDYNFKIGKAIELIKGNDILIIVSGTIISECVDVCEKLKNKGISAALINMHTIKPLDTKIIDEYINKAKLIVTVEEHNIFGGLGSAVAEHISKIESSPKQIFYGISDKYTKEGDYNSLKNKHELVSTKIMNRILKNYDK